MIKLVPIFFLLVMNAAYADDLFTRTSACRMEIKILGSDVLEEDESCVWLVENIADVLKNCSTCLSQLELIKEAANGNFDY